MRRDTCNSSAPLKAAGAVRSAFSRNSVTSAVLREGRVAEPEKMTSSMPDARMFLYELSPITQRSASTRLDFPQPFGPDDAGQSALDHELAGLDKGFEAEKAQPRKPHRPAAPAGVSPRSAAGSGEQGIDDRRHLVNRHFPRIFLAVDEERGRRVDAELVMGAFFYRPDVVQQLLVGQALVEGLL